MAEPALFVLCRQPSAAAEDLRLEALARFLGVEVRLLRSAPDETIAAGAAVHLAATCESLELFASQPPARRWLEQALSAPGTTIFLTGFGPSRTISKAIGSLLADAVAAVQSPADPNSGYTVSRHFATGMPSFAGLTFGSADPHSDAVFVLSPGASGVTELVTICGEPCYIKVDRGGASYFLAACAQVLDIDAPARRVQPIQRFLQFVPFLSYLRLIFGARCWHNEAPKACFIVDDPLLRERYGFLDFNRIESAMDQARFSMNIAFIPWNCRRTDRRAAERFRRPDRRFSISVHGCDHTEGEFGLTDEKRLRHQTRRALRRMTLHQELTGIAHNRVMVFPQGVFSKASLRALGEEGFHAAVNSTIYPVDAGCDEVTFRDHLDVAVVRFGGVPLFHRHYADRREAFALDLLLGRQVLIVEHHGFFRNGCDAVARCTRFINEAAPGIAWTDLEESCTSAALVRVASDGMHVRAFGSVVHLSNPRPDALQFCVVNLSHSGRLELVRFKNHVVPFQTDGSAPTCDIVLDPGQQGDLVFHRIPDTVAAEDPPPGAAERLKVLTRRVLCEIRDNYLDRSPMLTEFARRGKYLLPRL